MLRQENGKVKNQLYTEQAMDKNLNKQVAYYDNKRITIDNQQQDSVKTQE